MSSGGAACFFSDREEFSFIGGMVISGFGDSRKNRVGLNRKHAAPTELRPDLLRKASLAAKPSVYKINEYSPVFPHRGTRKKNHSPRL
jgi:hypothetical protein